MTSPPPPAGNRGCGVVLVWLVIIACTFLVCVAVGIAIFAMNIREHGGKVVHADLFSLIDTATLSENEKIALRAHVDQLIEEYQAERMTQDDFLAQAIALREDLVAKQPVPAIPPELPEPPETSNSELP